jgi:hypothetical protein
MKQEDDKLPDGMRLAARGYNEPPRLERADLDAMWSGIEAEAFRSPKAESREPRAVRWFATGDLLRLAAVLVLGVAIGRFALPRPQSVAVTAAAPTDSLSIPEPYQATTSRYLDETAALLVSLPAMNERNGHAYDPYIGRAHELLLTTRLLLDSPAASDARLRTLFEDLELVLAQVVRLQSSQGDDMDLIRQALEQRDVLPRLRTAVADFSADD